jgi:hypothetical protein
MFPNTTSLLCRDLSASSPRNLGRSPAG